MRQYTGDADESGSAKTGDIHDSEFGVGLTVPPTKSSDSLTAPEKQRCGSAPDGEGGDALGNKRETLEVRITVDGFPDSARAALRQFLLQDGRSKNGSKYELFSSFFKDFGVPMLTVMVAFAAFYIPYKFSKRAETEKASEARRGLIAAFLRAPRARAYITSTEEGRTHDEAPGLDIDVDQKLSAISLAEYGEDGLPFVKMLLASDEVTLRRAAGQVLLEMYRSEVIPRDDLVRAAMDYYSDGEDNPYLQRGVFEFFVLVENELSKEHKQDILALLRKNLGSQAEKCSTKNDFVLRQVSDYLFYSSDVPPQFLEALIRSCKDDISRETAVNALGRGIPTFTAKDRRNACALLKEMSRATQDAGLQSAAAQYLGSCDQ